MLCFDGSPVGVRPGFDEKYQRDFNIFNPINQYQPTSSNEIRFTNDERRSGHPANPINQFNPNNPFNPVNRYRPENPLNPINKYNPGVPCGPLNGEGGRGK